MAAFIELLRKSNSSSELPRPAKATDWLNDASQSQIADKGVTMAMDVETVRASD